MRAAEQMPVFLVRANLFHLDRKPFHNLGTRLLDDRRHRLVPLVRHAPERSREPYPRSKLQGITSSLIVRPGEMMLGVFQGVGFGQGFLDGQTDNITPVFYILLHGRACTQYILGFDTSQDF